MTFCSYTVFPNRTEFVNSFSLRHDRDNELLSNAIQFFYVELSKLKELLKKDRWIIDGNYLRTLELRLQECDTVFLLDLPVETCLAGAEARVQTVREDLPWVETEFDPEFRQYILDFPREQLPRVYQLLEHYRKGICLVILKSREEADRYLDSHHMT